MSQQQQQQQHKRNSSTCSSSSAASSCSSSCATTSSTSVDSVKQQRPNDDLALLSACPHSVAMSIIEASARGSLARRASNAMAARRASRAEQRRVSVALSGLPAAREFAQNKLSPDSAATAAATSLASMAPCEQIERLANIVGSLDRCALSWLLLHACELNVPVGIARLLIDHGANVNHTIRDQLSTCLMLAARHKHATRARRPVAHKLRVPDDNNNSCDDAAEDLDEVEDQDDKNEEEEEEQESDEYAGIAGDASLVELLLDNGAKLDALDRNGWTALFYAAYFGATRNAARLIARGAQVHTRDADHMTSLMWAAGRGHSRIVELLLRRATAPGGELVNAVDRYKTSALVWAARRGHNDTCETLLARGADINARGMYGWTALLAAVECAHVHTVRLLLEQQQARLDVRDTSGMSSLAIACQKGFVEIARALIKHGAPVNQPDTQNNTPIIHAAMIGCREIIAALLKAGADARHLGAAGRSAMHWAVVRNDAPTCELFLRLGHMPCRGGAGAPQNNINVQKQQQLSADTASLMLAAKHRSWDVIKLLLEHYGLDACDVPPQPPANKQHTTTKQQQYNLQQPQQQSAKLRRTSVVDFARMV